MKIELLEEDRFDAYEKFLLQNKGTLLYVSNNYRKLLKDFLKAKDYYFLAIGDNNEIKGALPAFLKQNDDHGDILNSLPFYGSNGGIIEYEGNDKVKKMLLSAFDSFAQERKCASTTIITSPFENDIDFYEKEIDFSFQDKRLGQLTKLPTASNDISSKIMNMIDGVRRRNIRKALKSNIEIKDGNGIDIVNFLAETHKENIGTVGGSIKPKIFFELIKNNFKYHENYKIYVAYLNATPIAALLVFLYNKTVEYFTPVTLEEYRMLQPLSLIIFEAMKDSVEMGYEWWNWGGTWLSQEGVYNFKKKWGASDMPYYYYTKVYDDNLLNLSKEELLLIYQNFYVIPFDKLNS